MTSPPSRFSCEDLDRGRHVLQVSSVMSSFAIVFTICTQRYELTFASTSPRKCPHTGRSISTGP